MDTNNPIALLIVEDDPGTLRAYRGFLSHAFPDLKISTAANTEEALASFREHHHDIVLSDLRMPNKDDGLVIARAICKAKPDAVMYLVTADSTEVAEALGTNIRRLCIRGIMGKPVDLMEVANSISEAVLEIAKRTAG